jgi:hypothetical protein
MEKATFRLLSESRASALSQNCADIPNPCPRRGAADSVPPYARVTRRHGVSRLPAGQASCTISISPIVSDVMKPASLPDASTTPTAGADFSCSRRKVGGPEPREPEKKADHIAVSSISVSLALGAAK